MDKNEGRVIRQFELTDEKNDEIFEITVLEFEDCHQMIFEGKKSGKWFGLKYESIDDLWEVIASFFIRYESEIENGGNE